ncbi:hypothetical protein JWJ90_22575, partial [Desulfobulbus rhabdoformis]|uniref:hypothetical protein n=1 Tax=Desulfobulbus rhabdoformis TaxID=34032 RepID=UPI0019641251
MTTIAQAVYEIQHFRLLKKSVQSSTRKRIYGVLGQGKRTKFLASKHTAKKPIIAGCSELFLLDTHFGFLSLQQITS